MAFKRTPDVFLCLLNIDILGITGTIFVIYSFKT